MGPFTGLPGEVKILATVAFTVAVGFGIQSPAIPVFASQFGVGSTAVGALVSAFAFARLATGVPGGRLVNRLGERAVLSAGMALLAITSVLAGLSWNYPLLLTFRGACGIGSAMYTVAAMNLLLRVTPAGHRGRATGLFQGAYYLGTVTGPALGGALLGFSARLPFFVYGGAVAIAGTTATIALARTTLTDRPTHLPITRISIRAALTHASYRAALTTNFGLGWAVFGVRVSVLPLFLLHVLHASPSWIGIGLATGAVLQAATLPFAGRLADVWGRRPSLVVGESLVLGSFLLVTGWAALPGYLAAFAVMGLGTAFCTTGGAASVGDVTSGRGGTAVAAYHWRPISAWSSARSSRASSHPPTATRPRSWSPRSSFSPALPRRQPSRG